MQKQLELLQKYDISISGASGQHFLVDPNIQRKIIAAIDPKPGECIIEIGPGLGALTQDLLASGAEVFAVEKDSLFCDILKSEYGPDFENLTVVPADILKFSFERLFDSRRKQKNGKAKFKVAGNIPYYITSPLLLHLIDNRRFIDQAVLMMQQEIVDRLVAQPGTKDYGRLTLLSRFYCDIQRLFEVSPNCFRPKPRVNSTVIRLEFSGKEPPVNEALFFEIVKYAFGERRKNILNALSNGFDKKYSKPEMESILKAAGIQHTKRAEQLLLKDFLKLAEVFSENAINKVESRK